MTNYRYDDIEIGLTKGLEVTVTKEMEDSFREITGDLNPLHYNDEFAKDRGFKCHVAFGMLTASFYSTLCGMYLPGENSLIHSIEVKFIKPVFAGNKLKIEGTVKEKSDALNLIKIKANIKNEKNVIISKATINVIVKEPEVKRLK